MLPSQPNAAPAINPYMELLNPRFQPRNPGPISFPSPGIHGFGPGGAVTYPGNPGPGPVGGVGGNPGITPPGDAGSAPGIPLAQLLAHLLRGSEGAPQGYGEGQHPMHAMLDLLRQHLGAPSNHEVVRSLVGMRGMTGEGEHGPGPLPGHHPIYHALNAARARARHKGFE